jgi:hypothetical protein
MNTPKEYRQQAADCLKLAGEAHEAYARDALADLATEFLETADKIERRAKREQSVDATDVDAPEPYARAHAATLQ